ncbi:MAG: hypothetical protein ABFS86_16270 [Planctomycetota bacterium]
MASRQRVEVKWKDLRLAARTGGAGYEESEVAAEDLVKKLAARATGAEVRPIVVWFYRPDQAKENDKLEASVFQNETVGLAFKRFYTYRVNVDTIDREELVKRYGKTPSFRFFDPAGEPVATLTGRRVSSLKGFTRCVEKAWGLSYDLNLKSYVKEMTKILDRLDKVGQKKTAIERDRARLAKKPNPRKQRSLEADEAKLAKEEARITEDEGKLLDKVQLKEKFQKKPPSAE